MLAEALDCAVYATAARAMVVVDVDRRENELRQVIPETLAPTEVRSPWVTAW